MKSSRKKDIKYGEKDLLEADEFDPQYGKERITLFLDQQVVDAFRSQAKASGVKYQTLIREALRELIYQDPKNNLEDRLKKLEAVVFKKRA
jgi:uncharacterized protein (DUF4415 family)